MNLNEKQRTLLQLILETIGESKYEGMENQFLDCMNFSDELTSEVKNNFRVGSVGTFDRSSGMKVRNIQYIVSVLKKCGYRVRFQNETYVDGEYVNVLRLERKL